MDALTLDASLWENPERAQKLISERTRLIAQIEKIEELENTVFSTYEMIELAEMENEVELLKEAEDSFS